jgi:F like protein/ferric iron reductase FhuF-like transporter
VARTSKLSKEAKARLATLQDSSATLLIASEEAAHRLTTAVVDRNAQELVARVAMTGLDSPEAAWASVARNLRPLQAQLAAEFEQAMLEARSIAREFAARQLAVEAEPVVTAGYGLSLTPTLPAAEIEAMWAQHAATGMARKFGAATLAETGAWRASGQPTTALPKKLGRVRDRIEAERKAHAVNQATGAYSEAKREGWAKASKEARAKQLPGMPSGPGSGSKHDWLQVVWQIWSALLDRKTCPVCWKLDGKMVKMGEEFPEGATTPLHRACRCDVITAFVPAELERYLPGTEDDYDALKADIADYMGSRRYNLGEGVRHAKSFVDEVFEQRGLSPVALTRRVNDRAAYFPNLVMQPAPRLLR